MALCERRNAWHCQNMGVTTLQVLNVALCVNYFKVRASVYYLGERCREHSHDANGGSPTQHLTLAPAKALRKE
jgi:hypothetical protein